MLLQRAFVEARCRTDYKPAGEWHVRAVWAMQFAFREMLFSAENVFSTVLRDTSGALRSHLCAIRMMAVPPLRNERRGCLIKQNTSCRRNAFLMLICIIAGIIIQIAFDNDRFFPHIARGSHLGGTTCETMRCDSSHIIDCKFPMRVMIRCHRNFV